jgi:hypothetical protein
VPTHLRSRDWVADDSQSRPRTSIRSIWDERSVSVGADVGLLSAVRTLRDGPPRQIDVLRAQRWNESQRDQPIASAFGAKDQATDAATAMTLPSVRPGTVMARVVRWQPRIGKGKASASAEAPQGDPVAH